MHALGGTSPIHPFMVKPDNIGLIDFGNILFMSAANDGAMGEPGAIYLVNENGEWYRLFDYEFTQEQLKMIPAVRDVLFADKPDSVTNWAYFYMGMGNNLFVRKSVLPMFREKLGNAKELELYHHWMAVAEKIISGNDR